jgi:hypothetical protein
MSSSSNSVGKHYVLAIAITTAIPGFIAFIAAIGLCFLVGRRRPQVEAIELSCPKEPSRLTEPPLTEPPRPTELPHPTETLHPTEPPRSTETPRPTEPPRPAEPPRPTELPHPTETQRPTQPPRQTKSSCPPETKTKIDHYIENHFPIYLIYLPDRKLWRRKQVAGFLKRNYPSHGGPKGERNIEKWIIEQAGYAIFSHRWSEDEPEYAEMNDGRVNWESTGGLKLTEFMTKAQDDYNCNFAWSDTVCIDKANNSEFQESLNSMFKWYRNASICIVHMAGTTSLDEIGNDEWFRRGWTLQELLAPWKLRLYDRSWRPLNATPKNDTQFAKDIVSKTKQVRNFEFGGANFDGINYPQGNDKADKSVLYRLEKATGIPIDNLQYFDPNLEGHVRPVFQWASGRETTRVEDMAYSLQGLFDIQLGVMYGEGERAFFRLQVELVARVSDRGLFVWKGQRPSAYHPMFAAKPSYFSEIISQPSDERLRVEAEQGVRASLASGTMGVVSQVGSTVGTTIGLAFGEVRLGDHLFTTYC